MVSQAGRRRYAKASGSASRRDHTDCSEPLRTCRARHDEPVSQTDGSQSVLTRVRLDCNDGRGDTRHPTNYREQRARLRPSPPEGVGARVGERRPRRSAWTVTHRHKACVHSTQTHVRHRQSTAARNFDQSRSRPTVRVQICVMRRSTALSALRPLAEPALASSRLPRRGLPRDACARLHASARRSEPVSTGTNPRSRGVRSEL